MISAPLVQIASNLPTDPSALESSISALERDISALESAVKALEMSSACWEPWVWVFSALVVVGVVMELWMIRHDWREEWETFAIWHFVGVARSPSRPYRLKLWIEVISVVFIAIGVAGELGIGVKISLINGAIRGKAGELRTKNAELRTESDKLIGLLHAETESEHIARVEAEESVAWRRLTSGSRQKLKSELRSFTINRTWFQYNMNDIEAFDFGGDLAASLPASWNATEPSPVMSMREGPVKLGTNGPLQRGIRVAASGDKTYAKAADDLAKLISSFGFDCERSKTALAYNPQYAPMIVVSVDPRPEGRQGDAKLRAEARKRQANAAKTN